MQGLFHDGLTSRPQPVAVRLGDGALHFAAGTEQRWALGDLQAEIVDDRVRLAAASDPSARLNLALADWRAILAQAPDYRAARRRREVKLVGALAGVALSVAGVVFVGIPLAAGPLARRTPLELERQMGDNMDGQIAVAFPACKGAPGQAVLKRFGATLTRTAGTPFEIRVRAVHAPMVNAFALPGGPVLVTDQLIALARTPDELSAVIAHEAAHVQQRHVMQAVWRAFGFGVLLDAMVGGGSGAGQQAVLLMGSFTNMRYGREAEAQADAVGQDLLQAQGLSSQGMATFFQRLAVKGEGRDAAAVRELISDHPDSARRAAVSRARARPGAAAFSPADWASIRSACQDGYDPLRRIRKLF